MWPISLFLVICNRWRCTIPRLTFGVFLPQAWPSEDLTLGFVSLTSRNLTWFKVLSKLATLYIFQSPGFKDQTLSSTIYFVFQMRDILFLLWFFYRWKVSVIWITGFGIVTLFRFKLYFKILWSNFNILDFYYPSASRLFYLNQRRKRIRSGDQTRTNWIPEKFKSGIQMVWYSDAQSIVIK
jgi:hypothetical protein